MAALIATSCADEAGTGNVTPYSSGTGTSSSAASLPATEVDLVALIESIPGYTYAPAPEVEQGLASELDRVAPPTARAVMLNGAPQGNVIILRGEKPLSDQDLRNLLAGAKTGGNKQGTATQSEIAGRPAVKSIRQGGGTTWTTAKGRYTVIVGTRPEEADDLTRQVLERLPG